MPAQPNRWKKRLGSHLRRLRDRSGISAEEVADALEISQSSVSTYESGHVRPSWPVVEVLLGLYKATDAERAEAKAMWHDAEAKPLRVRLPADASRDLRRFVRAELDARAVCVLAPAIIPGLLQTEAYMRELNLAGQRFLDLSAMDEYVKARLNRQKRLTGEDPLQLHALIDEAAIIRLMGGRGVMLEQLGHLLLMGAKPNITIQVLPFGVGGYGPMNGPCMIVHYPEETELPGVYVEYMGGGDWVENRDAIARITTTFDDARVLALSPSDSADLIRRQQRALETE